MNQDSKDLEDYGIIGDPGTSALIGSDGSVEKWTSAKKDIEQAIPDRGYNKKLNTFVTAFGSEDPDATCLLIPVMGFLPFYDDSVQSTVDAVMKHLMTADGLMVRYNIDDGLPGIRTKEEFEKNQEEGHRVAEAADAYSGINFSSVCSLVGFCQSMTEGEREWDKPVRGQSVWTSAERRY